MGMEDEFWAARDWVRDHLTFSHATDVSVFETTIRELGGLLSAYDLSRDDIFKKKVRDGGREGVVSCFSSASFVGRFLFLFCSLRSCFWLLVYGTSYCSRTLMVNNRRFIFLC